MFPRVGKHAEPRNDQVKSKIGTRSQGHRAVGQAPGDTSKTKYNYGIIVLVKVKIGIGESKKRMKNEKLEAHNSCKREERGRNDRGALTDY